MKRGPAEPQLYKDMYTGALCPVYRGVTDGTLHARISRKRCSLLFCGRLGVSSGGTLINI